MTMRSLAMIMNYRDVCVHDEEEDFKVGEMMVSLKQVVSAKSMFGIGGGVIDSILVSHFKDEIERKYGKGCCESPRSYFRLRAACEKLKKMLSTIEESEVMSEFSYSSSSLLQPQVGVDGLLPDHDVTIKLSRHQLNEMIAPVCHQLQEVRTLTHHRRLPPRRTDLLVFSSSWQLCKPKTLSLKVVQWMDCGASEFDGSRCSDANRRCQSAFDGKELRKTLDSNSAVDVVVCDDEKSMDVELMMMIPEVNESRKEMSGGMG
eukprot:766081-Hanusia_phi.AAC.8